MLLGMRNRIVVAFPHLWMTDMYKGLCDLPGHVSLNDLFTSCRSLVIVIIVVLQNGLLSDALV